jgi:PAS domain S-box-containing protein
VSDFPTEQPSTEQPSTEQPSTEQPTGGDVAMAAFAADGRVLWSNSTFVQQFESPDEQRRHRQISLEDLRDLDRRRMQALLANIGDTVTLVDAEGTILYTTGFHADVLGYNRNEWSARSILELAHPDDLDQILRSRQQVLAAPGEEFRTEVRVRAADSQYAWVELAAVNLLDDPAVGGIVITTRNVSARKELEQELASRRDQAMEDARIQSEFVARVTHELRNQIHALRGLTELLSDADVASSIRELAASARREAEQFEFLVSELLDYSRIDAGGGGMARLNPCDLELLIGDLAATARRLARAGVEVNATLQPDAATVVTTDERRLRQVLLNLLSNAAKFTTTGHIDLRMAVRDHELVATVSDTGIGIDADDLERIFLPFERARASESTVVDASARNPDTGAGLGLSISRQAVELLGGTLGVSSTPGSGSTFSVRVPCSPVEKTAVVSERTGPAGQPVPADRRPSANDPEAGTSGGVAAGRLVLVVEDTPAAQLLITEQLHRLGARPIVVGSGEAALDELARRSASGDVPALILVDRQLPGIDGFETVRRIRTHTDWEVIPVVGLSADADEAHHAEARAAGMAELIPKPLGLDELAVVLTHHLPNGIDTDALDALAVDLGDTEPVRHIVEAYLAELDDRQRQVVDGFELGDEEQVRRAAHTLRATSRTLGAIELDNVCTTIEYGTFPPDPDTIEHFSRAIDATRVGLTAWANRSSG